MKGTSVVRVHQRHNCVSLEDVFRYCRARVRVCHAGTKEYEVCTSAIIMFGYSTNKGILQ